MDFTITLQECTNSIDAVIYNFLPQEEGLQKSMKEAMNYSVKVGGKRIRPMLMLETCRLFGGNTKDVEPFMAAIELIHTSSLVHDDLPALDNDEFRRGKKTTHAVYGQAIGILTGDALLNYAYEIVANSFAECSDINKCVKAFKVLADKSGINGMLGGQSVDVMNSNNSLDAAHLDFIYCLKTSCLIEASMMIGAIIGGATDEEIKVVEEVARKIGLAFQIQDDILDLTSTYEQLGKPVLSDIKNNKSTYATLFGLDKAKKVVSDYTQEAVDKINGLGYENEFLNKMLNFLVYRQK